MTTLTDLTTVLRIMVDALDGDGSTEYMPDVTPFQACHDILLALDEHGYMIVRKDGAA